VVRALVYLLETRGVLAMHMVTRSAGIGIANKSALEIGVFMKRDSVAWDFRTV